MISTTWTKAPADLLGPDGLDVRPAFGSGMCTGSVESPALISAAPLAPVQGIGLPAGGTALRLRSLARRPIGAVVVTTTYDDKAHARTTFENNGTTLGSHSSRRPQS